MSKCTKKTKNSCKMCLQPVTAKNGLQCKGACLSWVHYSCLNYTPGRIKDIKTGIIKVTCPCPDCKTTLPKEHRTDNSFSCNNEQCPANRPPKCENKACPTNEVVDPLPSDRMPPLDQCGIQCKDYGIPPIKKSSEQMSNPSSSKCSSNAPSTGDMRGDSCLGKSASSFPLQAMEKMCHTVGELANQLDELMCKMKESMKADSKKGSNEKNPPCTQKGPKSKCPNPCFCPGNPRR